MKFKTPAVAIAAFITGAIAIPGVVSAQTDDAPAPEPTVVPAEVDNTAGSDAGELDLEEDAFEEVDVLEDGDFDLTPEMIAEANAETQKIVEALKAAGIDATVETEEDGFEYLMLPDDLTDAQFDTVNEVMDKVLVELYGDDFADLSEGDLTDEELEELEAEFEAWEPTAEELAEINADAEELIAALTAAGVPVERAEEDGWVYFDIPENLTAEQEAALEQVFAEHCPVDDAGEAGSDDGDDIEIEPAPDSEPDTVETSA